MASPQERNNPNQATLNKKALSSKASTLSKRDQLVKQYLPYAASIASKVAKTLSSDADIEEIISNARLGLLEAAKRFDPQYKVDFKTFSYYRIRGAIYDGLRKTGWIPRSLYSKIKFEQAANQYLQERSQQVAQEGGAQSEAEVFETVNSLASIYIISFDQGEETMEIEDTEANNIEQKVEFQKLKEQMRQAIETLPDKERKLIKMYYFKSMTLEAVGEKLHLSKSWTSRLHARALGLLFNKIHGLQVKNQDQLSQSLRRCA